MGRIVISISNDEIGDRQITVYNGTFEMSHDPLVAHGQERKFMLGHLPARDKEPDAVIGADITIKIHADPDEETKQIYRMEFLAINDPQEMKECGACGGSGWIECSTEWCNDDSHGGECSVCKGEGEVPASS